MNDQFQEAYTRLPNRASRRGQVDPILFPGITLV